MITSGEGKYKVWLDKIELDEDIVCVVGGGEKSHIGSVVIVVPGDKPNVMARKGHHDHEVLVPLAEGICGKLNQTVVVVGGIHIDNATEEEINIIKSNCEELLKCI